MLNEFCLNTGYHRKYAIRLLNGPPPGKQPERRPRGRRPRYGQQLLSILAAIWEAAGYPWSGAAEGLAAQLDALDSQALPDDSADRETAAGHQCTANRPAIEGEEERAETAYLRAYQARLFVEASHPGEDR